MEKLLGKITAKKGKMFFEGFVGNFFHFSEKTYLFASNDYPQHGEYKQEKTDKSFVTNPFVFKSKANFRL